MPANASPVSFAHAADVIFATISEVCYSRSILPVTAFNDATVSSRAPRNQATQVVKLLSTAPVAPAASKKATAPVRLDGATVKNWCEELRPWLDEGHVMRVSFGFGLGERTASKVLEEYIFDIRTGSPSKDSSATDNATATATVLELLNSLRFLSQTFDDVWDSTSGANQGPLVAFAKVYVDHGAVLNQLGTGAFHDAHDEGVAYYERAPFQLRVGKTHTASGQVVTMGVASSLDSLNEADKGNGRRRNASPVPDNLPMSSTEEDDAEDKTPLKRKSFHAPSRSPLPSSRKRGGRLAALHFN
jgi:hypothetical protein